MDAYWQWGAFYTCTKSGELLSIADIVPSTRYLCARHVAEYRDQLTKIPGAQIVLELVEDHRARHHDCDGETVGL